MTWNRRAFSSNDCWNPSPPRIFDEWIRRGTSASPRTHGFSVFAPGRKTEAIVFVTGSVSVRFMTKSVKLKVGLDHPESGWLRVELAFGDQQYCFYPSHVPYDSVTELVNALLKTLDGYDKAVVRWNDEPVKHEFVFEPKGKQIDFRYDPFNISQAYAYTGKLWLKCRSER